MNYFLVLEKRPKDFMPINIQLINKDQKTNYFTLQNIDNFTRNYTSLEIKDLIKENNLVTEDYLKGNLWIINENKYRYPVFTKDIKLSIDNFLLKNIHNKQIMNKFINIYSKYSKENLDLLKENIQKEKVANILQILFSLDYLSIRNIYFYLNEKCL